LNGKSAVHLADQFRCALAVLLKIAQSVTPKTWSYLPPLSPHKAVNGSPINAAKFFQSLLRRRRFTLCFQHHAPMRILKAAGPVISVRVKNAVLAAMTKLGMAPPAEK
jgi:hypothetical protein